MAFTKYFLSGLLVVISSAIYGQTDFVTREKQLAFYCDVMVNAAEGDHRWKAYEVFHQDFDQLLKTDGSFSYPFDSLKWISNKMADDQSFRILSWEVVINKDETKYFGYLQMADGTLYPLTDHFKDAEDIADEEFTTDRWLGALYYNMMGMQSENGDKYYLLFGVHKWDKFENVKLVDVLFFTKDKTPIFGKSIFRKSENGEQNVFYNRLVFKYAADGMMTVNYNPGLDMIVFDNLIPRMSRSVANQRKTMVSDGSYVGYSWDKKYWNKVDKIATEVMNSAPRPKPILDQRSKNILGK